MKHLLASLLLAVGLLPHFAIAQQQVIQCNTSTGAACNTSTNPGNGNQGDPAWLSFGKTNANFTQIYTMLGNTGTLPAPAYGLQFNNNGTLGSLIPGSTGTWCFNWSSLSAPPTLVSCGSGSGTVTSVGVTVPSWLSVSGSPVTSSGTIAISGTIEPNNYVVASAATGSQTVVGPRLLVAADIPALPAGNITGLAPSATTDTTNASNISSGTLASARLPATIAANTTGTAAGLSGVSALPNGTTATTQTTGDSTTKVATDAMVQASIAAGNSATATALAGSPTQCGGVQFSTGIAASGNANCGTPTVSASDSVTGSGTSGSPLLLSGDSASPGDSMCYGTNSSGTKGWYACGGSGGVTSFSGDGALLNNSASTGSVTATLANTGVGYGVWGNIGASTGTPGYHALSTYPTAAFPTLNQSTTGNAATATSATTATNIAAGTANQIPYQTGVGATSFFSAADYGVQIYGSTGVPSALAGAAGVLQGSASANPAFTLTPTLTGTNFSGTAASLNIGGNAATATSATTATNIAAGAADEIPYQTAAGTTAFTPAASTGYLNWNGTAFVWSTPSGSGVTLETNGASNSSQTTLNLENSAATDGLTLTATNVSAGNVQLGFTGTLSNTGLANPATTVNSQTCTLGSTCTIPFDTNSAGNTSQAGINLETSTTNSVGLTVTPTNSATNVEKFEITGSSYTGNAATATTAGNLSGTPALPNGTTATTQTAGDTSTKLATDNFVSTIFAAPPATGSTTPAAGTFTTLGATSLNGNTFTTGTYTLTGSAGKTLDFTNSLTLSGTDSTTETFPSVSATLAGIAVAQTWSALQKFTNADFALLGTSTGYTQLESANASATDYVATLPAATDTVVELTQTQTLTNKTISGASNTLTNIPAANLTGTASVNTTGTASNVSGTPALPNGTTATTQTTGDSSTDIATDAFVIANAAGVSSVAAGGGIAVTGTGSGPYTGAVTVSASAPNRTVTSSPTVASTDMGGQINSNVSGGGTLTIPAISSSVFPANSTLTVVNYSASTEAVSTTPTVNAGGGCVSGTGIPAGSTWNITSNGTTLDCNQTISAASGGSGTVASSTTGQIPVYTASTTVTGSANATLTAGALTLGVSGTAGSVKMGNATSGTVTLQPVTGALGTVTASLPAATDTIVELTQTQTLTNKSIAASEVNSGTLAAAQMPALTGAVTSSAGSVATSLATIANNTVLANVSGSTASPSATSAANVIGLLGTPTCNAQTGTTYTLALGDANICVTMSNTSANTLTIPTNASVALPVGTTITIEQLNTGLTTITPASGVTLESQQYGSSTTLSYPLIGEYDFAQFKQVAANTWLLVALGPGRGNPIIDRGTTFTLGTGTGTCATTTTLTGGASTGSFTCTGTGGASTQIINLPSAPHGWVCEGNDLTTTTDTVHQTASSATSCTLSGTIAASDNINFIARGY